MICGMIVEGDREGRELGFPTANIDVTPHQTGLGDGVYAALTDIGGQKYKAALVVNRARERVEVHVLNFSKDIYGEIITVFPREQVSEYTPINDLEELKEKIITDVEKVKEALKDVDLS